MRIANLRELEDFAKELAKILQPGDVLLLEGDLGAGKTTLTQFLLAELGVEETVQSPTFSLVKTYDSRLGPAHHVDLYRLDYPEEIESLDYEEFIYPEGISIIEWPSRAQDYMPEGVLTLSISIENEGARSVFFVEDSARAKELNQSLLGER